MPINSEEPRSADLPRGVHRVNVLGVGISALDLAASIAAVGDAIENRKKGYICVTGVHGVSEAQSDPEFRKILNAAFLCTPDGMPMVWMGKLGGFRDMDRVYGPDLMLEVFRWSQNRACRHFLFGGAPGVAESLKASMESRFPGVQIPGCYTPPFRPLNESEENVLQDLVSDTKPDILWVGLSTPKQERFMADYLGKLDVTLMIGVGAAFDFHTGRVRQAPKWMQRSGLEWFFRLYQEPKRLWRRYLRNNPLFLGRVFLQLTRLRKYRLEE
ncbi:MAG: WecB/TagA/CpsF family glycosyltransferase [Verrucomicrobia bacterium]|nr:WecB/TagA/CpsF family glycosyltransferase [Verrucomicrobiota bacterium]